MKLSRRNLLALAGAGVAAAQTTTQTTAPAPSTPEAKVASARDDNRKSAERLTQFEIPIETEPAFSFRA